MIEYTCKNLKNGNISPNVDHIMNEVIKKLAIDEESLLFYNIRLAIWEIFCNIIVHAHNNTEKKVYISIKWDSKQITMTITDFGDGFDWKRQIPDEAPGFEQMGGRGLLFIDQICETFSFDESGRRATIIFLNH